MPPPTVNTMSAHVTFIHSFIYDCTLSPVSRAHMSGRDGEGAAQAPPASQNVHVHQQDPPHGLSPVVPGRSALWCLLRRHQDPAEEGGVPVHRRQLVLRRDGNRSGMWLLQVPVVTASSFPAVSKRGLVFLICFSFLYGRFTAAFSESYTPTRPPLKTLPC